jgi:hypothetical protein
VSARTLAAGYMTGRSGAAEGLSAAERKMEEPLRSSGAEGWGRRFEQPRRGVRDGGHI